MAISAVVMKIATEIWYESIQKNMTKNSEKIFLR